MNGQKSAKTIKTSHKEAYYQKKIMDYIKETFPDAVIWKNSAGPYSQGGIPDISVLISGHYFGIEVKRPGGKPSALQELMIRRINKAGGTAGVCATVEDAKDLLGKVIESVYLK